MDDHKEDHRQERQTTTTPATPAASAAPQKRRRSSSSSRHKTKRRKSAKSGNAKLQGEIFSVFLLAAAIGALCGVGYLAYLKFSSEGALPAVVKSQQQTAPAQRSQAEINAAQEVKKSAKSENFLTSEKQAKADKNLYAPSEYQIQGEWIAPLRDGLALLSLDRGIFEITFVYNDNSANRKYSGGTYTYDSKTGKLDLIHDRAGKLPPSTGGVKYTLLTNKRYSVKLSLDRKSGKLYWTPVTQRRHPLFFYISNNTDILGWIKNKKK